ncbi:transposase [Aquibium sp. LZ166]|uniref:Transposase n=1 Tax=Aquibium pacificus TaxID=3153579 RepID=A0ABV3SPQ2_9HYPH
MTISELTLKSRDADPIRRLEIFTGAGRRREWPPEEKARIVAESYAADETVCAVARRHGLTPQQLFTWRREARKRLEAEVPPGFVPAIVVTQAPMAAEPKPRVLRRARRRCPAAIEMEASGVMVRIVDGTSPATIAAVIHALKAAS